VGKVRLEARRKHARGVVSMEKERKVGLELWAPVQIIIMVLHLRVG